MVEYKLDEVEMKFTDIIWENEAMTSKKLTIFTEKKLNWNISTTYF